MIYPLATITARNLDEPLTGRLPVRDTMSKQASLLRWSGLASATAVPRWYERR
jgi:hypothetical protein